MENEYKELIVESLDGVCLVDLRYLDMNGLEDLINCKPGSIIRVLDVDKAVRFIDYPNAISSKVD